MSEPIRITKAASASELTECLGWIGEEIQKREAARTREDIADALRDQFIDRSHTHVTYTTTTEDSIIDSLRVSTATKGHLRQLASQFESKGVPAEFLDGLRFAIAMIRDHEFEL
jgi:hypothetical protein